MRKKTVSSLDRRSTRPTQRALHLSKETIRTLTNDDLSQAVSGCPLDSSTETQRTLGDSGACV
jgi:hypothetical protein